MTFEGVLQYYNYGEAGNLKKYGNATAPVVNMDNFKTLKMPVSITAGFWDHTTSYENAIFLSS